MLTVQKYAIDTQNGSFGHDLPNGSRLLGCGDESSGPFLYAAGDDQAGTHSKTFIAVATGAAISQALNTLTRVGHVTVGGTVFHVFDTNQ